MIEILAEEKDYIVCIKPAGVLSTDEAGGLPELLRETLGDKSADIRTVHRLDRVVSGLMVVARSAAAAADLSAQIRDGKFKKSYLAVAHGEIKPLKGTFIDLLGRDKARKMTYVAAEPAKGVQEAVLDYEVLDAAEGMSLVQIELRTGRTHQIRCQLASRGYPLAGERKYSTLNDPCPPALWSYRLQFKKPGGGEEVTFKGLPNLSFPWSVFAQKLPD